MNRLESVEAGDWKPVADADVEGWNQRLLQTDASFCQYPFWNEPCRRLHLVPEYLVYGPEEVPSAYACVLTLSAGPFRIGLLECGPVSLVPNAGVEQAALRQLVDWAKRNRYTFLRISNPNEQLLQDISPLQKSLRTDSFPFFTRPPTMMVVKQREDDKAMLASFQRCARQQIARAVEAGYEIRVTSSPERFVEVWPLFESLQRYKGFKPIRPASMWVDTVRLAQRHGCAHLYTAYLDKDPVATLLVVRDAHVAEVPLAALDRRALGSHPSPSVLLHWRAMRDAHRRGCEIYSFGPWTDVAYTFKRKFHPVRVDLPKPVTLVLRRCLYRTFSLCRDYVVLPTWPLLQHVLRGVYRNSSG